MRRAGTAPTAPAAPGCSRCSRCSDLKDASPVEGGQAAFIVPKIENIHQKIYEAVNRPNALNMGSWHTCDTTHCRAGWAVFLAGQTGRELEEKTSTQFAALQIYKASSPIRVSPTRFFESNEVAMADMKKCAQEEQELLTQKEGQ